MAHVLLRPLATMQLIGEALRNEAWEREDDSGQKLEKLAQRVDGTFAALPRIRPT